MTNKLFLISAIATLCLGFSMKADKGMASCNYSPRADVDDSLIWSRTQKLKWKFFGSNDIPDSLDRKAYTAIRLEYSYKAIDTGLVVDVWSVFYPSESWVKEPSKDLLKHEQGKFGISEVTARLARLFAENIFIYDDSSALFDIDRIVNHEMAMTYDSLCKIYDSETDFGSRKKEQRYWNKWIRKNVWALREYRKREVFLQRAISVE